MKKTLKLFIYILLGITFALGGLILALEISSQRIHASQKSHPAPAYLACDPILNPPDQDKITFLTALGEKHREGISITRDDLDQALILVPAGDMVGLNGVYCNGMIFISDRLKQGATIMSPGMSLNTSSRPRVSPETVGIRNPAPTGPPPGNTRWG